MRFPSLLSFCAILASFTVLGSSAPVESEIICHGKDCYPRVFQATEEFQVVRDDQTIPKGLHVRMDFHTGLKEARLYDGVDDPSLQAVEVFTDDTIQDEPVHSPVQNLDSAVQQLLKAKEEGQGAIRPPPGGSDGISFTKDTKTLLSAPSSGSEILPALENLEDLSHDIYWGLRLTQDGKVVHKLNSLIGATSLDQQIRSTAALLLGTAIQNNPAALSAALYHFYNDDYPTGPLETVMLAFVHEQIPSLTVRLVYLLSELCQDQSQLLKFIKGDGLVILRELYDAQNANHDAKDKLRQKISNFVLDHFLTEDSLEGMTKALPLPPTASKHPTVVEDSWIIVDKDEATESIDSNSPLNARASLSKWCEPFSTSMKQWGNKPSNQESRAAQEHVSEAAIALNDKLKSFGCSCDMPSVCQDN